MLKELNIRPFESVNDQAPIQTDLYKTINISDRAKHLLERKVDKTIMPVLMDPIGSLPEAYHSSGLMLRKLTAEPVQKITLGRLIQTGTPIVDYVFQNDFNPQDRRAGSCGDITRWFLHDMITSGTADKLADKGVVFNIASGKSPTFFNLAGSRHVFTTMGADNHAWEVLIDPSFGNVVSIDEKRDYEIESKDELTFMEKNGLFQSNQSVINGWDGFLVDGIQCPSLLSDDNPHTLILGISKDERLSFAVGVESKRSKPFLSVTYPYGAEQDIYWLEESGDRIGSMTSESRGLTMPKEITNETISLVGQLKQFRFQEANPSDAIFMF